MCKDIYSYKFILPTCVLHKIAGNDNNNITRRSVDELSIFVDELLYTWRVKSSIENIHTLGTYKYFQQHKCYEWKCKFKLIL